MPQNSANTSPNLNYFLKQSNTHEPLNTLYKLHDGGYNGGFLKILPFNK